jgi:hypothetical protein
VPKPKKQPQTGTFTIDEVMEAVREDRQKDIEAGREFYPMPLRLPLLSRRRIQPSGEPVPCRPWPHRLRLRPLRSSPSWNDGVNRFVEAGRKLITHKARIDEAGDDWGLWVAKAFPAFAPRTLGRYMTLARRAEDGEAAVMLPASEDSDEPSLSPVESAAAADDDAPDLRQQSTEEADKTEARKQQLAEAQARRRAKLAEAAGRTVKPRKSPEPATIHATTRTGSEKAVYDRVMFMVEKAEDEDQLRMIERHISKVFPELARLATEAGLTGKE